MSDECFGGAVIASLIDKAARIERSKNGQALTPEEAQTMKAVAFLRVIAPYAFDDTPHVSPPPPHA